MPRAAARSEGQRSRLTLDDLAAEEMGNANNNVPRAVIAMQSRISADPVLYQALIVPIIKNALWEAASRSRRSLRSAIDRNRSSSQSSRRSSRRSSRARIRLVAAATMMEWPLPSGKAIGDATKSDLRAARQVYQSQIAPLTIRERWYGLVENKLPSERHHVRNVMNLDQITKLYEKAEQGR
jgi:hypothetical protein